MYKRQLVGYITDTFLSMKKYLVLTCLGAIATTCLLPLLADSFPLAVLSAFIYFLFSTPISHLMDTWVVTLRDERPYIDYGKTRFGGSLGYAIMAAAAGWLISLFSSYMVLYLSLIHIYRRIPARQIPFHSPQDSFVVQHHPGHPEMARSLLLQ